MSKLIPYDLLPRYISPIRDGVIILANVLPEYDLQGRPRRRWFTPRFIGEHMPEGVYTHAWHESRLPLDLLYNDGGDFRITWSYFL